MLKKIVIVLLAGAMITGVVLAVASVAAPTSNAEGRGPDRQGVAGEESRGRGWAANSGTKVKNAQQECSENADCEDCASEAQGKNRRSSVSAPQGNQQYGGRSLQQSDRSVAQAGRGTGRGGSAPRQDSLAELVDLQTLEGTVTGSDEHIVLELADGSEVELGIGPEFYREELEFAPELGDRLTVSGFYEDGEFKVASIVDESETTYTFRDEYGRPMWSGRGRGQL
jgi:hypothetical protein